MVTRYVSVVFLAAMVAMVAAVVVSVTQPEEADAASTVPVKTCGGGTIQLNSDEKRTLDLHNQIRANNGLSSPCVHPALTQAAHPHSQEMLDKGYFSHNSYNGETVKARLERFVYTFAGYSSWRYGGNIYWGSGSYGTPDRAFTWWMNSSGHKANILKKDFREGRYRRPDGHLQGLRQHQKMYTVDFGVRR